MRNCLLAITLLFSTIFSTAGQAESYKLSIVGEYGHLTGTPIETSEPLLIMPLSIVSRPKAAQHEINYTSYNGSMFVNGKVNGIPMRFVVDTGASVVVIPPAIAKRAGIDTSGSRQIKLQTANGIVTAPLVTLNQVVADDVAFENVPAAIQNISAAPDLGLLGMTFFGQHKMTIDHAHSIILLEPK